MKHIAVSVIVVALLVAASSIYAFKGVEFNVFDGASCSGAPVHRNFMPEDQCDPINSRGMSQKFKCTTDGGALCLDELIWQGSDLSQCNAGSAKAQYQQIVCGKCFSGPDGEPAIVSNCNEGASGLLKFSYHCDNTCTNCKHSIAARVGKCGIFNDTKDSSSVTYMVTHVYKCNTLIVAQNYNGSACAVPVGLQQYYPASTSATVRHCFSVGDGGNPMSVSYECI